MASMTPLALLLCCVRATKPWTTSKWRPFSSWCSCYTTCYYILSSFFSVLCARLVAPSVHNPLGAPYGQHNANTRDPFTMPRAHARSGAAAGSCLCPLAVAPRLCVVQVLLAAVAVAVAGQINPLYKSTLVLYHMTPAQ